MAAFLAVFFGLGALSARAAGAPDATPVVSAGFDAYVLKAMHDWGIPGLSIAIVRDGRVYVKGYGVRALGNPAPVDSKTIFQIGSSSKAFTVAALGMLVDEKKISWDDRIIDRLAWFQMYDPWVTREVTIRDALSHRTGLARADELWANSDLSRDQIVRRLRYLPPAYSFRARFEYNNNMVLTAGQIVPAVTGMSWDTFVHNRIFVPLAMTSSTTTYDGLKAASDVAAPHDVVDGKLRKVPPDNLNNIAPAGGINSNAIDMSHWLEMLLNGGTYRGHRLLQAKTLGDMWAPETIMPLEIPWTFFGPISHFMDYGMGWILDDYRGHKAIQHAGNVDGMTAMVGLLPDERAGIVILTNKGDNFATTAIMNRFWDETLNAAPRDWSAELHSAYQAFYAKSLAAVKQSERIVSYRPNPSLPLSKYAGTYHDDLYGNATVTLIGGKLHFRMLGYDADLEHFNQDSFRLLVPNTDELLRPLVTFEIDPFGRVSVVRIEGDPNAVFARVPAAK